MHPIVHHAKTRAASHFEEKYRKPHGVHAHIILTIDGILVATVLALLAVGSYFAFVYDPLRDDFKIELETAELVAGKDATLDIRVSNAGEQRLEDVEVDIFLPSSFVVFSEARAHELIEIGVLPPEASMTFQFQGVPLGPSGGEVIVRMRAQGPDGGADERFAAFPLTWSGDPISLEWSLPETVVRGQDVPFRLELKNTSELAFDEVVVRPQWPEGFTLRTSSPPLIDGQANVHRLGRSETIELSFLGRFEADAKDMPVSARAVWSRADRDITIAEAAAAVTTFEADLALNAEIAEAAAARPGEDLRVTVRYENLGDAPLKDVRIRLPLDARIVDAARSSAEDGGREGQALAWAPVTLPALEEIAPGDAGELQATIRIASPVSRFVTDALLALEPEAVFDVDEAGIEGARLAGERTEIRVATEARLAAVARYYTNEGDQLGRGPLPPRVGAVTRYWTVLKVESGSSGIAQGRVVIRLPAHVEWTGRSAVTAGFEIEERGGGRILVWNIGDIPAHAGPSTPPPNASFELALTPTTSQIGTSPHLIESAGFSGRGTWTGLELSSSAGALTTALPTDPLIEDRITVQP